MEKLVLRTIPSLTVLLFVVSGLSACDSRKDAPPEENKKVSTQEASAKPASEVPAAKATGDTVSLAAEGSKFDPPVTVDKIPEGAWMCDMNGSVHFASPKKGDGKCPTCSMALVHRMAGNGHHMPGMDDRDHGGHE